MGGGKRTFLSISPWWSHLVAMKLLIQLVFKKITTQRSISDCVSKTIRAVSTLLVMGGGHHGWRAQWVEGKVGGGQRTFLSISPWWSHLVAIKMAHSTSIQETNNLAFYL